MEQLITFDDSMYTSTEIMNSFSEFDKTTEVVLFVADVGATRVVEPEGNKLRFNAVLSNFDITIQLVAWNDKAKETEQLVKSNEILHIQNLQVRKAVPAWNKAQMDIEIVVTPTTIFKSFRRRNVSCTNSTMAIPLVPLQYAAFQTQQKIRVRGTVRAIFVKTINWTDNLGNSTCGLGAITDGTYKLPVRIMNFNENYPFCRGDLVEIVGTMQRQYSPISLVVNCLDSITEINGERLPEIAIIKGGLALPTIRQ